MLDRIDRILVVAADRRNVAGRWMRLLDAETLREDTCKALAARRTVLRLGASEVEVLEPDGAGPVERHLASRQGGPFAAGFAAPDPEALARHLEAQGVSVERDDGRLLLSPEALGIAGLRAVVSAGSNAPAAGEGLIRRLYEVTHLTPDAETATRAIAGRFGLAREHFVPIRSDQYGYAGSLTLFHPDRLDRVETITPYDLEKTMGRFFARFGPALYMSYAETDRPDALRERLQGLSPRDWTGPREGRLDNLFLHPQALGGVMLGVSRTDHAWTWSGHPERARPRSAGFD
jgi:hypothetical protein